MKSDLDFITNIDKIDMINHPNQTKPTITIDIDDIIQGFERDGGVLIGSGGDGKVYHYRDFAIKVHDGVKVEGLEVYDLLGSDQNEFVMTSEHLIKDDVFYEIMPYYCDGNLGDHLDIFINNNTLQEELYTQLSSAIKFLHEKNIQHRDLKTGNILIKSLSPLEIVVCDFGRSKVNANSLSVTQSVGTFKFMAPEALAGMPTKYSDYFSLGIIMAMVGSNGKPFKNEGHLVDNSLEWSNIKVSKFIKKVILNHTHKDSYKRCLLTPSKVKKPNILFKGFKYIMGGFTSIGQGFREIFKFEYNETDVDRYTRKLFTHLKTQHDIYDKNEYLMSFNKDFKQYNKTITKEMVLIREQINKLQNGN